MSLILKRDPVWLQCLPPPDASATLLLLGGDGQQVAVPAPLLLAASPTVRSILTDHLPPAFSPCCISIPATTGDVLQVFGDIIETGTAAGGHENKIEDVHQVFEMLGVDAWIVRCHLVSIQLGQALERDVKLECFDEVSGRVDEGNITHSEVIVKQEETVFEVVSQHGPQNMTKTVPINLEQSHTKEIPNNSCTQKFIKRSSLKNRKDSVHKKLENICNHCKHNFYDRSNLKKHIDSVHKKIKYQCSLCPHKFSLKQGLVRHTVRVHPDLN